jgi:PQQ-like domain
MGERHMTHSLRSFSRIAFAITACLASIAPAASAQDWPSFRGVDASGVADAAAPPVSWDLGAGRNIAWTAPIPGAGHSSPIVWGDRVFLTSAVSLRPSSKSSRDGVKAADPEEYRAIEVQTPHAWRLYCLERTTGRVLWERTAYEGVPRVKRHAKASQASATPSTDGKHVVAMIGSEGLYAYDMEGRLLWKRDFGRLDVGYVDDPTDEWGPASSPVIHDGLVIVQNDRHKDSYVAAFDVVTGGERWRVGRDELPAWSTPIVHRGARSTLVTNSPRFIRGHDPATGKELWRIPDVPRHTGGERRPAARADALTSLRHAGGGRRQPPGRIRTAGATDCDAVVLSVDALVAQGEEILRLHISHELSPPANRQLPNAPSATPEGWWHEWQLVWADCRRS